uniref:Protein kinase domain-containing protein n=1 Tax=Sinocyclocheilus anshuiensis TaxID=1608454 RepID=A0A671QPI4_9TELE
MFSVFRGRFSVVRKCLSKASKKEVAVKFVNKKMQKKDQVAHEADILRHVQHPQLVALLGTYESPKAYMLVLELVEDGRLLDYLVAHDELMEEKVAFFIKDTLEALQHLHTCRVAHLDLKPENLLVDLHVPASCVKLSDLGDAVHVSGHRYVHLLLGNPEFAAPELIQGTPVSLSTDVWSVGVLAYVMLSGVSPFLDESLEETCVNICRLDFCFPEEYFSGVSQAAKDFIVSTLHQDPRKRPSSATCLQHPWVSAHSGDYSKTPLDTVRLAAFIDRRKQLHDVRPVTNVKGLNMGWRKEILACYMLYFNIRCHLHYIISFGMCTYCTQCFLQRFLACSVMTCCPGSSTLLRPLVINRLRNYK